MRKLETDKHLWKNLLYCKCQLKVIDWQPTVINTFVHLTTMEKRWQVIIEVEGEGSVTINYKYKTGQARAVHDIHVNAHDLANLLDLVGAPNLLEMHRQMSPWA